MPNPYPTALRERAVRAYEGSAETYAEVAARFSVHINTLVRWVQGARDRGTVLPAPRGGGWYSPVDISLLHALIKERPDRTTQELTRAYNERAAPEAQVHRSSVLRALQRTGYVFKKNARGRPSKTVR
jgi:transposase